MKKLNIICIGIVLGVFTGFIFPKEVPAEDAEPVIFEKIEYVEVVTVEEDDPEPAEEVQLPEVEWIPGNASGFILLDVPLDEDIQEYVYEQCIQYNIDYYLVMGLIKHESEFTTDAVSSTGDYGLMQINQVNHKDGVDYLDPYQNISEGMMLLDYLFDKYDDPALVLMAYNMGEKGASGLWKQGIYNTDYVNEIFLEQELLQESVKERKEG